MPSPSTAIKSFRLEGLDAARGCAIALMFLSHTVKALLSFGMMPRWGVVPIHVMTKFSSTLFILVFGVTLSLVFLPKAGKSGWGDASWKMIKRAALIMLWYKILIVVQMFQRSPPQAIIRTLTWQRFPDFVEILQFYAWFVLLLVVLLPLWKKLPFFGKGMMVAAFAISSWWLQNNFDFWGIWQLKAVLVEDDRAFCYGVIGRGAMALAGLYLGDLFLSRGDREVQSVKLGVLALFLGVACLGTFITFQHTGVFAQMGYEFRTTYALLRSLAMNWGKHPPNLPFFLFSNGGAMTLLGLFLLARGPALTLLKPLTIIGRESFVCFNFHIVMIFVGYRYFLDLRHNVTYPQALALTGGVFVSAIAAAHLNTLRKRRSNRRRTARVEGAVRGGGPFGKLTTEEAAVASQFDTVAGPDR
ncbi:MAG: OpgC domain-containing protein [Myxococcota bacterium]